MFDRNGFVAEIAKSESFFFEKIVLINDIRFKSRRGIDWNEVEQDPDSFLPFGSEGSLKMDVIINPNLSSVAAYVVVIWGDLRDHDDTDAIVKWFKGKLKDLYVRQACITVSNEQNGQKFWSTDIDD